MRLAVAVAIALAILAKGGGIWAAPAPDPAPEAADAAVTEAEAGDGAQGAKSAGSAISVANESVAPAGSPTVPSVPPPAPWIPLKSTQDIAATVFGDFDTLKVYHLMGKETLFEVGGLHRPISIYLTALGFHDEASGEKVALSYLPANLTFTLTPMSTVGQHGLLQFDWKTDASVVSALDIAEEHWDVATFLGTCSSQTYRHMMDVSLAYGLANPNYQPFSVYDTYPGKELLAASSPDNFVWTILAEFGKLGVTLHPVLAPKKVRIVLFSNHVPDVLQVSSGSDRVSQRVRATIRDFYINFNTCIQQRRFRSVDSLESFVKACDCLDNVAFLLQSQNATEGTYHRVVLSSNQIGHFVAAEVIEEPTIEVDEMSWVDMGAVGFIVAILLLGINGILLKTHVYECILSGGRLKTEPSRSESFNLNFVEIEMTDEPSDLRRLPASSLYKFSSTSSSSPRCVSEEHHHVDILADTSRRQSDSTFSRRQSDSTVGVDDTAQLL